MITLSSSCLAVVGQPMFGSPWLALGVVLIGVAALMAAIAYVGRVLAATHPEPSARPPVAPTPAAPAAAVTATPAAPASTGIPAEHITAIIAAVVAATVGRQARIVSMQPQAPSVEMLMQQWSLEGRRQIYSSHQVR